MSAEVAQPADQVVADQRRGLLGQEVPDAGEQVALEPALLPAREALAATYRTSGRHMDASEQLEAIATLDRGRPERLIALGLEYADARRTDLAVATLGRATERFPDNVEVYASLGEVWLRTALETGDRVALGKAREALRTAVVRGGSGRELGLYGRALLALKTQESTPLYRR